MSENTFMFEQLWCFVFNTCTCGMHFTVLLKTYKLHQQLAIIELALRDIEIHSHKVSKFKQKSIIYMTFAKIIVIKLLKSLAYEGILVTRQEGSFP